MERGRATAEPHENYASHGAGRGSTDGVPRLACSRWGEVMGRGCFLLRRQYVPLSAARGSRQLAGGERWIFKDGKNGMELCRRG